MQIIELLVELLECIAEGLGSEGKTRWIFVILAVIIAFLLVAFLAMRLTGE